ncbi:hypothetical protein [Bradyrhizobium sp. B117]|uniref:hypothetical protein n=1 Tax=Bradyrhizobium sp. B117 TaxID=3140246 RepID=UPI0031842EC8
MAYISDIEQLSYLGAVARQFSIDFRLYGGVAFRCVRLKFQSQVDKPLDLFELTPFAADIDLVHSGTDTQTPAVFEALLKAVPDADCFRWEIRSEASQRVYERSLRVGGVVPARTLSLVDDGVTELIDPTSGSRDIATSNYRYHVSPFFKESELYKNGQDLPILSALLYLQTLFEASVPADKMKDQDGWHAAKQVFSTHGQFQTLARLQQHSYLRARFRYLLLNAFASAPTDAEFFAAAEQVGLKEFIASAQSSLPNNPDSITLGQLTTSSPPVTSVLSSSSCTVGDIPRVPLSTEAWTPQAPDVDIRLGPGQEMLLVSPKMALRPGAAPSVVRAEGGAIEFLHFRIPQKFTSDWVGFDERRLSLIMQLRLSANHSWSTLALPCVAFKRTKSGAVEFRVNCFGYLESFATTGTAEMRVCVVGLAEKVH